jgi:DNA-binding Lrp family transcriptional regulator
MVNAIVLLNVQPQKVNEIAEKLVEINNVSEVYSVGGRFDIVAVIRGKTNEDISDVVTRQLLNIQGINSSETLIAFRAYSRHDLERLFAIGE